MALAHTSFKRVETGLSRMDFDSRETLLTLGTTATMLVGIALVLLFDTTLTIIGILLIVASTILFVVDSADLLAKWQDTRET